MSPTTSPTPTITLKMSEAVTVSGTPELLLSNGGTANYNAASSTSTSLAFTYIPSSPQSTTALSVIGLELSSPSAIVDGAGNAATLSGAAATLGVKVNAGGTGSPAPITVSGTSDAEISAHRARTSPLPPARTARSSSTRLRATLVRFPAWA